MGVYDFQKDPHQTECRMLEEARQAVEQDGAEAIILGCTIEFGVFRTLQKEIGVPELDATITPLNFAELKAELHQRYSWPASKRGGFETPPKKSSVGACPSNMKAWERPGKNAPA